MSEKQYAFPFVPGPTSVAADVLAAFSKDYPSADCEENFFLAYEDCASKLKSLRKFARAYLMPQ